MLLDTLWSGRSKFKWDFLEQFMVFAMPFVRIYHKMSCGRKKRTYAMRLANRYHNAQSQYYRELDVIKILKNVRDGDKFR